MSDPRTEPIAVALRAVLEDAIATADLERLVAFAYVVFEAVSDRSDGNWDLKNALFYATRDGASQVRDDKEAARRLALAKQRRPGETDSEYAARLKLWGLDDD